MSDWHPPLATMEQRFRDAVEHVFTHHRRAFMHLAEYEREERYREELAAYAGPHRSEEDLT